ncbi:MAG: universal stress protein [Bacteroidia bacterium]|nr:universal stress protein [Bacteroidia bacterium]
MKILSPTDFSKLSNIAVRYAGKLAKKLNAELILLHVVYIDAPPRAQATLKTRQILDAMADNAKQDFTQLINEIKSEAGNKINVSHHIALGYPVEDVIKTFAQHNTIDLIIMGMKGSSGLKKMLIGSTAVAVMGSSRIPVITIPEHARFNAIKSIVYPSDMHAISLEVKNLIQFAKLFNASIHILHVVSTDSKKKIDRLKIKNKLISKYNYPRISFHISVNDQVTEAIDEYAADTKADLLAMFTHKPTFFEKLFGQSITREMAFHGWIPLLAIKKNKTIQTE